MVYRFGFLLKKEFIYKLGFFTLTQNLYPLYFWGYPFAEVIKHSVKYAASVSQARKFFIDSLSMVSEDSIKLALNRKNADELIEIFPLLPKGSEYRKDIFILDLDSIEQDIPLGDLIRILYAEENYPKKDIHIEGISLGEMLTALSKKSLRSLSSIVIESNKRLLWSTIKESTLDKIGYLLFDYEIIREFYGNRNKYSSPATQIMKNRLLGVVKRSKQGNIKKARKLISRRSLRGHKYGPKIIGNTIQGRVYSKRIIEPLIELTRKKARITEPILGIKPRKYNGVESLVLPMNFDELRKYVSFDYIYDAYIERHQSLNLGPRELGSKVSFSNNGADAIITEIMEYIESGAEATSGELSKEKAAYIDVLLSDGSVPIKYKGVLFQNLETFLGYYRGEVELTYIKGHIKSILNAHAVAPVYTPPHQVADPVVPVHVPPPQISDAVVSTYKRKHKSAKAVTGIKKSKPRGLKIKRRWRYRTGTAHDNIWLNPYLTPLGKLIKLRREVVTSFEKNVKESLISPPLNWNRWLSNWMQNIYVSSDYSQELSILAEIFRKYLVTESPQDSMELSLLEYQYDYIDPIVNDEKLITKEARVSFKAMLDFILFVEQLIRVSFSYYSSVRAVEAIRDMVAVLNEWITEASPEENTPEEYEDLVRWFSWFADGAIEENWNNTAKDGDVALTDIKNQMVNYFNSVWGQRVVEYGAGGMYIYSKDRSYINRLRGLKHGTNRKHVRRRDMKGTYGISEFELPFDVETES